MLPDDLHLQIEHQRNAILKRLTGTTAQPDYKLCIQQVGTIRIPGMRILDAKFTGLAGPGKLRDRQANDSQ